MPALRLRPMSASEFDAFRARVIVEYAAVHVEAGNWSQNHARELAAKQTDELLPGGVETPGVLLLVAEDLGGALIGRAWVALERHQPADAWIYQIEVVEEQRGRGYGRALLAAIEQQAAGHGAETIGLNVFGGNAVARGLYDSSGYDVTSLHMRKKLHG